MLGVVVAFLFLFLFLFVFCEYTGKLSIIANNAEEYLFSENFQNVHPLRPK